MTSQALQQKDERSRRFGGVLSKYVHYSEGKNAVVLFDLLDAIKDFSADFPNDPHCLELQSVLACDGKNWVAARTYLTAAASLGSQNLNVHRDLSYVNLRLRDFSEVRRHCLHCIERDGTSINDYYGLAAALYALDRVKEAIPVLDKALRDHPDLPLNKDPDFLKRQTRAQARSLPSIMLNTLFKSASMYIVTRLARGLNIPRCYITSAALAPDLVVPSWLEIFSRGGALSQEHLAPTQGVLRQLEAAGISKLVVHTRDRRQAMISGVHHLQNMFGEDNIESIGFTSRLPQAYPDWSVGEKIDYYIAERFAEQAQWVSGWQRLASMPAYRDRILLTSYEEFHLDNRAYFEQVLRFYNIEQLNFNWSVLDEDTRQGQLHFRSGKTDEWKSLLSTEQISRCNIIMKKAGFKNL